MTGATLPYNLRLKKTIERNIFIELLQYTTQAVMPSKFAYVSMGGPYLQDHADVHASLGWVDLISFDSSEWVVQRQAFNRPVECIQCLKMSSDEIADNPDVFFERYVGDKNCVIWLDYTGGDRGNQLSQVRALVPNLKHGDVIKITMNARIQNIYAGKTTDTIAEIEQKRLDILKNQLGTFFPATASTKAMTANGLPPILGTAFFLACSAGVQSNLKPVPLTAFHYADGEPMATFCVAMVDRSKLKEYTKRLERFALRAKSLSAVAAIEVPTLSLREKVEIDRLLFTRSGSRIRSKLKLSLAEKAADTNSLVNQYKKYYRYYPKFARITAV
jgi:hypothetical protein